MGKSRIKVTGGSGNVGPVKIKWIKITNETINSNTAKRAFFRADAGSTDHYGYIVMDSAANRDQVKLLVDKMFGDIDTNYDENAGSDIDYQYSDQYTQNGLSIAEALLAPNTHILVSNIR
jgi:hypothetical protein